MVNQPRMDTNKMKEKPKTDKEDWLGRLALQLARLMDSAECAQLRGEIERLKAELDATESAMKHNAAGLDLLCGQLAEIMETEAFCSSIIATANRWKQERISQRRAAECAPYPRKKESGAQRLPARRLQPGGSAHPT